MSDVDALWDQACRGDRRAFGDWAGRVERPVLLSLRWFAPAVDTESIVQETLLRMWHRSQEEMQALTGENASLRSAIVTAANLARNMARKHRREHLLPPEDIPVGIDPPDVPALPDPLLARIINACLDALPGPLRRALRIRIDHGHRPAAEQARVVGMTVNTLHQNIVRARRRMQECLRKNGVDEHEDLR